MADTMLSYGAVQSTSAAELLAGLRWTLLLPAVEEAEEDREARDEDEEGEAMRSRETEEGRLADAVDERPIARSHSAARPHGPQLAATLSSAAASPIQSASGKDDNGFNNHGQLSLSLLPRPSANSSLTFGSTDTTLSAHGSAGQNEVSGCSRHRRDALADRRGGRGSARSPASCGWLRLPATKIDAGVFLPTSLYTCFASNCTAWLSVSTGRSWLGED